MDSRLRECYPVRIMRAPLLLVLLFAVAPRAFSQTAAPAQPDLPKDPRELLAMAAPFYDFNDPALKPWHLKATYQFYDEKSKPTEQGIYEYWWVSPKIHRSSWTRPAATRTDWATSDGMIHRKESGGPTRYFERTLNTILLHPLPSLSVRDVGRVKLDLKVIGKGKSSLVCATTALQWQKNGVLNAPPSATPQYYCFDPPTKALRMTFSDPITTEYDQIVKTQGRYLARQTYVLVGERKVFSIFVEEIKGTDPSAAEFSPPADSVVVHDAVREPDGKRPGDSVTTGMLVKKTQPVYPIGA